MPTYRLQIDFADRETAHLAAGALGEVLNPPPDAISVFENAEAWLVEAFFETRPDEAAIADGLALVLGDEPLPLRLESLPERNWVAISQAALPPVLAGRFTVFGGHDRHRIPRGPNSILIEAGEAFGTAHHATTFGCLLAIDAIAHRSRFGSVLDLGTGSGVLAIALARAQPGARILATDIDERSIEVACENARANAMTATGQSLTFKAVSGLADRQIREAQPFDLIVANILAGPLQSLAGDITAALGRRGQLVLSGILVEQAPAVIATYRAHGLHLTEHRRIEGWSTLVMRK